MSFPGQLWEVGSHALRHRTARDAQGRSAISDRPRALCRRHRSAAPGLCGVPLFAARPCRYRDRHQRRGGAGGPRGADRQDWTADGLGTIDPEVMPEDMGGPKGHRTQRHRWRSIGYAMSASASPWSSPRAKPQARDAAELVAVDYEILPAVVRAERRGASPARRSSMTAPRQHLVHAAHGQCRRRSIRPSPQAAHVTRLELVQQPPHRLHHGAARLPRRIRRRHRPLHALHQHPERARRPPRLAPPDPACAGKPASASSPAMSAAASA